MIQRFFDGTWTKLKGPQFDSLKDLDKHPCNRCMKEVASYSIYCYGCFIGFTRDVVTSKAS